jgi:hypothetical protein
MNAHANLIRTIVLLVSLFLCAKSAIANVLTLADYVNFYNFSQSDNFIGLRVCCHVVSAAEIGERGMAQRVHQSSGLPDLARILQGVLGVRERSLGIAKQPRS